jgi:hypothetical protein
MPLPHIALATTKLANVPSVIGNVQYFVLTQELFKLLVDALQSQIGCSGYD